MICLSLYLQLSVRTYVRTESITMQKLFDLSQKNLIAFFACLSFDVREAIDRNSYIATARSKYIKYAAVKRRSAKIRLTCKAYTMVVWRLGDSDREEFRSRDCPCTDALRV